MKKIILMMLICLPIFAHAEIKSDLKTGSKGSEVIELQNFLINKGFLKGEASGSYFSLTKKAVISYQLSNGIKGTGLVGPMTRNRINSEADKNMIVSTTTQENLNIQARILEFQNKVNSGQPSIVNNINMDTQENLNVQARILEFQNRINSNLSIDTQNNFQGGNNNTGNNQVNWNTIRNNSGTTCNSYGDTTRCSDGTTYRTTSQNTVINSDGSICRYYTNSIRCDNGSLYSINGNTIIGNDNTICHIFGNTIQCNSTSYNDIFYSGLGGSQNKTIEQLCQEYTSKKSELENREGINGTWASSGAVTRLKTLQALYPSSCY